MFENTYQIENQKGINSQNTHTKAQNCLSELEIVHILQTEYEIVLEKIFPIFHSVLTSSEQIRVRKWIKKLSSVINNIYWRRNRNLYIKLLYVMIQGKIKNNNISLRQPFHKQPTQGSLNKLVLYQIPYDLRPSIQLLSKQLKDNQKFQRLSQKNLINQQTQSFKKPLDYHNTQNFDPNTNKQILRKTINPKFPFNNSQPQSNPLSQQISNVSSLIQQSLQFISDNYHNIMIENDKNLRIDKNNTQMNKLKNMIQMAYGFVENNSNQE